MTSPRPPPPTKFTSVAVPTMSTRRVRSPAKIPGAASGSCTCSNDCKRVIPIPRAASTRLSSMPCSAATVFRTIGSSPYTLSASTVAGKEGDDPPRATAAGEPDAERGADNGADGEREGDEFDVPDQTADDEARG